MTTAAEPFDCSLRRQVSNNNNNCQQHSNYHHHHHKCRRRKVLGESKVMSILFINFVLFAVALFSCVEAVVVYDVSFVTRRTNRTDYALVGESLELTCHYIMKDEIEDIKSIQWLKDDKIFLRWNKRKPGLEVMTYTFKGHIDNNSTHSHLIIHNVTTEMHAKYKCRLITDLGPGNGDGERQLVVISSGQCRLTDWRISSNPEECSETLRLDCKAMFPKPAPTCGLWNSKSNRWISALPVHIFEDPSAAAPASPAGPLTRPQVYRVQYAYKFQLGEGENNHLLRYAGHLVFKCDIEVPDTSWRLSIAHKMFDFRDGCESNPLDTIDQLRANYSKHARARLGHKSHEQLADIEMLTSTNLRYDILPPTAALITTNAKPVYSGNSQVFAGNATAAANKSVVALNCWQKPRLGSLARLSCLTSHTNQQPKLIGSNLLECRPNGWVPIRPKAQVNESPPTPPPIDHVKRKQKSMLGPRRATRNQENATNNNNNDLDLDDDDDDDSAPITTSITTPSSSGTENNNIDYVSRRANLMNELTPSELASLLPTCVAITSRRPIVGQHQNRLPLLNGNNNDDDEQAKILESSDHNVKNRAPNRQDAKWYTFFATSSSSSSSICQLQQQGSHYFISLTIVSITFISHLMAIRQVILV